MGMKANSGYFTGTTEKNKTIEQIVNYLNTVDN